jgi:hypothetical protein
MPTRPRDASRTPRLSDTALIRTVLSINGNEGSVTKAAPGDRAFGSEPPTRRDRVMAARLDRP